MTIHISLKIDSIILILFVKDSQLSYHFSYKQTSIIRAQVLETAACVCFFISFVISNHLSLFAFHILHLKMGLKNTYLRSLYELNEMYIERTLSPMLAIQYKQVNITDSKISKLELAIGRYWVLRIFEDDKDSNEIQTLTESQKTECGS